MADVKDVLIPESGLNKHIGFIFRKFDVKTPKPALSDCFANNLKISFLNIITQLKIRFSIAFCFGGQRPSKNHISTTETSKC
jgi:hypothetical protein